MKTYPFGAESSRWRLVVQRTDCPKSRRSLFIEPLETRAMLTGVAFVQHAIETTNAQNVLDVHTADLDGDGDLDVVSALWSDNTIAWYENTDGKGHFGPQQIITTRADGAISVYAADLDGDGDFDVLSGSNNDQKVAWYENTDGKGSFGPQQIIDRLPDLGNIYVYGADLDGDGDNDVLATSLLAWYENTDGVGTFGPRQVINTDFSFRSHAADLDNDGDLDVVSTFTLSDEVAWHKNTDGAGTFGPPHVTGGIVFKPLSVRAADVDGDGDLDLISASSDFALSDNKIAWYENMDGSGVFGPPQLISTLPDGPRSVFAEDMDLDGDLDVLAVSHRDTTIAWYENTDGAGTFGPQQIVTTNLTNPQSLYPADIDADGDIDVLSVSGGGTPRLAWHENTINFSPAGGSKIGSETLRLNLAATGVATQSSVRRDDPRFNPSNAIDGELRTRSQTDDSANEHWWEVALSNSIPLDHLVLTAGQSLTDGGGLRVQLLNEGGDEVWRKTYTNVSDDTLRVQLPTDPPIEARRIRLAKLAPIESRLDVAEVEVYASDFLLASTRTVTFDLNALDQSADLLRFEGSLRIDGATLRAELLQGVPAEGMQFELLDTLMTSGTFDHFFLPELPPELVWNTSQLYEQGLLRVGAAGSASDFDGDGEVSFRDFLILSSTFGEVGAGLLADADGDHIVDFDDFLTLSNDFGARRA